MARGMKRHADPVDGLLLLNKPSGMSSNRALQVVRRLVNARKAGHTGSLDPAATGMLPLCFGEATKVCAYMLDADKGYRVTARLGSAMDTGDADGSVIATADIPDLSFSEWEQHLQGFLGESTQIPPMYSALKKDGKRLYELARKGESVERQPRPIRIDAIRLLEAANGRLVFRVDCSKGTYIRVLVEDIAKAAGTVAHTQRLHREWVGNFDSSEMMHMSEAERLAENGPGELLTRLLPPDRALMNFPGVDVSVADALGFRSGKALQVTSDAAPGLLRVYGPDEDFLGLGMLGSDKSLAPRRVFAAPQETV